MALNIPKTLGLFSPPVTAFPPSQSGNNNPYQQDVLGNYYVDNSTAAPTQPTSNPVVNSPVQPSTAPVGPASFENVLNTKTFNKPNAPYTPTPAPQAAPNPYTYGANPYIYGQGLSNAGAAHNIWGTPTGAPNPYYYGQQPQASNNIFTQGVIPITPASELIAPIIETNVEAAPSVVPTTTTDVLTPDNYSGGGTGIGGTGIGGILSDAVGYQDPSDVPIEDIPIMQTSVVDEAPQPNVPGTPVVPMTNNTPPPLPTTADSEQIISDSLDGLLSGEAVYDNLFDTPSLDSTDDNAPIVEANKAKDKDKAKAKAKDEEAKAMNLKKAAEAKEAKAKKDAELEAKRKSESYKAKKIADKKAKDESEAKATAKRKEEAKAMNLKKAAEAKEAKRIADSKLAKEKQEATAKAKKIADKKAKDEAEAKAADKRKEEAKAMNLKKAAEAKTKKLKEAADKRKAESVEREKVISRKAAVDAAKKKKEEERLHTLNNPLLIKKPGKKGPSGI